MKTNLSNLLAFESTTLCAAMTLALLLLPMGRAAAQIAPGPLAGAAATDQQPAAASARSAAPIAGKPNLGGTWKLNADLSDNPMQKMRQAQQDSGGQGGGGRRGGWGGGGGMGGGGMGGRNGGQNGGGQPDGDTDQQGQAGRRQGGMRGMMAELVIEQTPTSTKVSDSSGRVLALYVAPSEQGSAQSPPPASTNSANDANPSPVAVAEWQDNKLVAKQPMRNGGGATRTYEMSSDNQQLIVTTTVENKRFKQPVTFRQVYDPVYASTGGD